jgi:hypothetical protein
MSPTDKTPAEVGVEPTKNLAPDEAVVTVPDGDFFDPTDLDIDGDDYDEERDGPIPDYPDDRIVAELDAAAAAGEVEG